MDTGSEQVPLIRYQRYADEVELPESRESPDEVLQVASFLVGATSDTLENAVEHEDTVDTEELRDLLDRRDDLKRRLGGHPRRAADPAGRGENPAPRQVTRWSRARCTPSARPVASR